MVEQNKSDIIKIGKGIPFERIRRITGYLVGNLDRFNDAKKAEVRDRIKHFLEKTDKKQTYFKRAAGS